MVTQNRMVRLIEANDFNRIGRWNEANAGVMVFESKHSDRTIWVNIKPDYGEVECLAILRRTRIVITEKV
jgi:hypothetical protein